MNQPNKINGCAEEIFAIAHVISLLFEIVENEDIKVNTHAVACLCKRIADNASTISLSLEE